MKDGKSFFRTRCKASARLLQEQPVKVKLNESNPPDWKDRVAKLTEGLPSADQQMAVLLKDRRDGFVKNKGDAKIKKNYELQDMDFQQTRTALIGSVVAVRETLKLAHDRADFSKPKMSFWTEIEGNPWNPRTVIAEIRRARSRTR